MISSARAGRALWVGCALQWLGCSSTTPSTVPSASAEANAPTSQVQSSLAHASPSDRVPWLSQPQHLGSLVGPGSTQARGLQLYGTDLGISFEHQGQLFMLFGDTWNQYDSICGGETPLQDDTQATLPLDYQSGVPLLAFETRRNARALPSNLHVYRGERSLRLGYGQAPMAGWSDGQRAFVLFERLTVARCETSNMRHGSASCQPGSQSYCTKNLGLCQPSLLGFDVACDLTNATGCVPGQTCEPVSLCLDPTSSQYDDGHYGGQTSALTYETEIATPRADNLTDYDSVLAWHTNKFSHPAARTIKQWTGQLTGNDYQRGNSTLLLWGRPGFIAEQGRDAKLYLLAHSLPMQLDAQGQLQFTPRYFAGLDAVSGQPRWSEHEAEARPLALDGRVDGDTREEVPVLGPFSVTWLPEPINRFMMLYGGDLADYLMVDPNGSRAAHEPGSIVARFAEHPWGPWSKPIVHLSPGLATTTGAPYGPGGFLYHPECFDQPGARCARSDPHRPLDTIFEGCPIPFIDPGRLYAPNIIDQYTRPNATGGLDIVWNVSTWNPYGVQLLQTSVHPAAVTPPPADELSDARGLAYMSHWRALPKLSDNPGRYRQQTSYDRGTRDDAFPLSDHGNRDFNNFICKSADAVVPEPQFAPFKFDQAECPEPYVHGFVLGRFEGSGRMVRMWLGMQSLLFGPADEELLRIYVDDDPQPRVELPLVDVLSGAAGEIFAPPFGAGSPRRMAWYYPVAFEHKLIVALDRLGPYDNYFYHCDVVLDDTARAPAAPRHPAPERDAARRQLSALYHPAGHTPALGPVHQLALPSGETRQLDYDGPATIYELKLRFAEAKLADLSRVQLQVFWENDPHAAIDLPLLELFGTLDSTPPDRSTLALSSYIDGADRVLTLELPLPFATHARFRFHNTGAEAVAFEWRLRAERELTSGPVGHLHTERRESSAARPTTEHVAAELSGRGRLVGLCGYVQGHADPNGGIQTDQLNLLEGDVRAWTDGELAMNGTGTEEYTDDVFYYTDAPHARAFGQAWGVVSLPDAPPGSANFCRWHVLGTELDFRESLKLTFEIGGAGNPGIMEKTKTVAFYYLRD